VLGDHLLESNNPLAIAMRFKHQGFTLSDSELLSKIEQSNGKLLIMIHGSCMNDLQWFNKGSNQAEELADDLEAAALYVHYNSGLHISENGKTLSSLFEKLTKISSRSLEITILAHSMGGLVSRSACYYEEQLSHNWKTQIKSIIFLGTPHHGAPLEKAGNWVDHFLSLNSYMAPLAAMAKIRSCGITDLRYGNIIDEDWRGECRFKLSKDKRSYVNLPESIKCFSIAASTNKNVNKHSDNLIGDGLVSLNSALGKHLQFDLNFPQDRLWIARNMNHMDLLSHKAVFQKIRSWV
jgi:pimeloyl-ACP methyl ester carboxylesterase